MIVRLFFPFLKMALNAFTTAAVATAASDRKFCPFSFLVAFGRCRLMSLLYRWSLFFVTVSAMLAPLVLLLVSMSVSISISILLLLLFLLLPLQLIRLLAAAPNAIWRLRMTMATIMAGVFVCACVHLYDSWFNQKEIHGSSWKEKKLKSFFSNILFVCQFYCSLFSSPLLHSNTAHKHKRRPMLRKKICYWWLLILW